MSRIAWPSLVLAAASLAVAASADRGINDGIFRPHGAGPQPWVLSASHTLIWNDRPYVPVGAVFASAYLREPGDAAFQADRAALDGLKAAGVSDLWIDPQRGLLECTPAQVQAILDLAQNRGFRYGLRVGDRPNLPLIGFAPGGAPRRLAAAELQPGQLARWRVPARQARRVLYTVSDRNLDGRVQNWAIVTGHTIVERDGADIQVTLPRSRLLGKTPGLLHVVPEIQVEPEDLGSYGDLWAGMEPYAARLDAFLRKLKFGDGFRFLIDPFAAGDGSVGREDAVFPSSEAFQDAFREWISRNAGLGSVNTAWRLADRRIPDLATASRLVPTWAPNDPPDGDGWLVDPVENVAYRCDPRGSSIWQDLDRFRADSLKRWMNRLTNSLKQDVVNVPVLFSWAAYHPVFSNTPSPSGYDGLGAVLRGTPASLVHESAAYALAQVEEADRNTWLVALGAAGASGGSQLSVSDLLTLWTGLQDAGYRGIYLDPRDTADLPGAVKALSTAVQPESKLLTQVPVCFFPRGMAGTGRLTRLSNGVWWLPAGRSSRLIRYGDDLMAYDIERPLGEERVPIQATVMWCTGTPREATFFADQLQRVQFFDTLGNPLKIKTKRNMFQLLVGPEPVLISGLDAGTVFPQEMAEALLDEFDVLLRRAEAQRATTTSLRTILEQARRNLTPGSAAAVYAATEPHVARLRSQLYPHVWLEGERPASHNYSGQTFLNGASQGMYLRLDRSTLPASGFYRARYLLDTPRDGSYEIWLAGLVPGTPGVSPLIWQLDEEPAATLSAPPTVGSEYAPGMSWISLGRMTLKAGRHELTLVVADPASETSRYRAGIDAVLLSQGSFSPSGTERPYARVREDLKKLREERSKKPSDRDRKAGDAKPPADAGK